MYSTCLFCNNALGANEIVASFPIGRRLVFDQKRGRLWVVCRKCEKWNLTPLEERWEAIEQCEQLFRDTRKRVSTDNIGLARLNEGLELVRIGEPQRPEFAAWRYGDQFGRRQRRRLLVVAGMAGLSGLVINAGLIGGAAGSVALGLFQLWSFLVDGVIRDRKVIARVPHSSRGPLVVRHSDAIHTLLVPGETSEEWSVKLRLGRKQREFLLTGDEARRIAARVVPHINTFGGSKSQTAEAVRHLEEARDAQRFLSWAARNRKWKNPGVIWLGVEMALNEENERHALASELALLEEAWKEAEEIAAIADNLALPRSVESGLRGLQSKRQQKQ